MAMPTGPGPLLHLPQAKNRAGDMCYLIIQQLILEGVQSHRRERSWGRGEREAEGGGGGGGVFVEEMDQTWRLERRHLLSSSLNKHLSSEQLDKETKSSG
uniref:Uncharacterized protein n=1 Tax=Knipowitschia caucasica TaxID=637954 RepID=A0AAV2LZV1_KNICA